jgi:uncharacterized protein involved in outer membrane biogenesis
MAVGKGLKTVLFVAAGLVVVLLVLYAAVIILLPKEKIVEMVVTRAEQYLNRSVSVGDVSVRIWGGIGLRLSELEVRNLPDFSNKNLMELKHLDVSVKLWPLFSKRVEITKIELTGLTVNLERNKLGAFNFDDMSAPAGEGVERIESPGSAAALPFAFEDLRLSESEIHFLDDSAGYSVDLSGIEAQSSLVRAEDGTNMQSTGKTKVGSITYKDNEREYSLPESALEVDHSALLEISGDSLAIEEFRFAIADLEGWINGSVRSLSTEPELDLSFRTNELKTQRIIEAIPPELFPAAQDLVGSGVVYAAGTYHGPARLTRTADLQGKMTLKDIVIAHDQLEGKMEMRLGELVFTQRNFTFYSGDAKLAGEPFSLKIIVDNIPDPSISAELSANVSLRAVEKLMSTRDKVDGRILIDATAYGKLAQVETVSLLGSVQVEDLKYESKDLDYDVRNGNMSIEFLGRDAKIDEFHVEVGESDLNLSGSVNNVSAYIMRLGDVSEKPVFKGDIRCERVNVDELFGTEEDQGVDTDTMLAVEPDTAFFFLPDFDAIGSFRIDKAIYTGLEFDDVTGKFNLTNYVLYIDSIEGDLYDGEITGEAIVDIEDIFAPQFQVDFTSSGVEVNRLMSTFTGLKDHVFGDVNLVGSFSGSGSTAQDVLKSLKGNGTASIEQGKIVNFEIAQKVAESLGKKVSKEERIQDYLSSFRIEDGRVQFDAMELTTSDGYWQLTGSVGFDGSLDYSGTVTLSSKAADQLDFLGPFKDLLKGDTDKIMIPFKLTGTYSSPQMALDTSPIEKNVDNKIKEDGKKLLDKLFKR